ncbi:MAG: DUF4893 domain-containing protein [Prevotella sp.]|nr:DUF4893 domain-containing protein [Prevotella sp.]
MKHQIITAAMAFAAMQFVACPASGHTETMDIMSEAMEVMSKTIGITSDTVTTDTSCDIVPALNQLIHADDYLLLVGGREKALEILDGFGRDAYGIREAPMVRNLLTGKPLTVSPGELKAYRRVRSIQVNNMGIFSYPYFACRFREKDGKLFFEKTTGSQRKSGYVYENTPMAMVFLGGWSVNNDPQTTYDSVNSEAGMIYKIGAGKIIMLFVRPNQTFEIYELKKQ